jgi:nicotinamidase-related amidase
MDIRDLIDIHNENTALLLIDVINDFDFPDGHELIPPAIEMAHVLFDLLRTCLTAEIPVIYVNDNFGDWQSSFDQLVEHCLSDSRAGQVTRLLKPHADSYYILKPMQSGFFGTSLDILLRRLKKKHLILTGLTTDQCVAFTANDAYLREYALYVPRNCTAAAKPAYHKQAISHMGRVLRADTRPWPAA